MEFRGSVELGASPEAIWAAMIDPGVLAEIIPYAQRVERLNDSDYLIHVAHNVAGFDVKVKVALKIDEPNPPHSWRLQGKATQMLLGAVTAWANVAQEAIPTGTRLTYVAGGNLPPRLQSMLGEGFDRKVTDAIDAFFVRLEGVVAQRA